jgi:polysaccharide pyruvyl transferase WcaK-like protein
MTRPFRIGIWGLLGSGNLGNDGSMEAVLSFLASQYPAAAVDALCSGPDVVTSRYGIPAAWLHWNRAEYETASGVAAIARKVLGKGVDAVRTAAWVRRHDAVIVPGMGVLESSSLPLRAWGTPFSLFVLCLAGRLLGTKIALISVGANKIDERMIRWLVVSAARLAHYRSYRDEHSRESMREMGFDSSRDPVYPDLVFSLPNPPVTAPEHGMVGVGIMNYHGGNKDRNRADDVHHAYVAKVVEFVRWLLDGGHRVRLLVGAWDDVKVVDEIMQEFPTEGADAEPRLVFEPIDSLAELMRQMASVETVVATRFHNVLCAVKIGRPTISIGYDTKNEVLLDGMGLDGCAQRATTLDVPLLVTQFTSLRDQKQDVEQVLSERSRTNAELLQRQFNLLSETVLC